MSLVTRDFAELESKASKCHFMSFVTGLLYKMKHGCCHARVINPR